ncbi:hypothetical protein ANO11243_094170 [Dothideomycetidae sp. 11243]|nr:hypothetical protein ANO11243_094170 [fungal sp. No.11243]
MAGSTPIITCGDHKPDAIGVHAGMKSEYEVIYAAFSLPETFDELPQILAGTPPAALTLHTQVASNDFSRHPVAIIVGGGYDDEAYGELRQKCIAAVGGDKKKLGAAFFRADNNLTDRLVKEGKGPEKRTKDYPAAITKRLKNKLEEVGVVSGLKEEDVGELFWY